MPDYPTLHFISKHPHTGLRETGRAVSVADSQITWPSRDGAQGRAFSDIATIALCTFSTDAPGEASYRAKLTFTDATELTVYCHRGKGVAPSDEETAYRAFLLTLHGALTAADKKRIAFRNRDGVTSLRATIIFFPISLILASAILVTDHTTLIPSLAILLIITAGFLFAITVHTSPTRRFYDPDALPARLVPQP